MGPCREPVMHSSGRCGWREQQLFTRRPHGSSYTLGNTMVREQATFGGWLSETASLAVLPLTPEPTEHPRFSIAQCRRMLRLPSSLYMHLVPQLTKLHATIPSRFLSFHRHPSQELRGHHVRSPHC